MNVIEFKLKHSKTGEIYVDLLRLLSFYIDIVHGINTGRVLLLSHPSDKLHWQSMVTVSIIIVYIIC